MGLSCNRVSFLVFISIVITAGVACIQGTSESTDPPIVITPVAFQTRTPTEIPAPTPTLAALATPTPTPWPLSRATPLPAATATPSPVVNAAPTPTSRPTSTPVPTKTSRWIQIQRDYRDRRITYDQAVELAIETGMSRPQARIALAQIRIP